MIALDISKLPPWALVVLQVLGTGWMLATGLALALRTIPNDRYEAFAKAYPSLAHFARAARKVGTDFVPFVQEVVKGVLALIRTKGPPVLGLLLVNALAGGILSAVLVLEGCGPTAVQQQATIAHLTAETWNEVGKPTLLAAYREDQRQLVDRHCPPGCSAAAATEARQAVASLRARWGPVWDSLETARADHDAWRAELEFCRRRPEGEQTLCLPRVEALMLHFVQRVGVYRCQLRAVGHPELDPFDGHERLQCATPLPVSSQEVSDGGQ
jgi:hypothetical protein